MADLPWIEDTRDLHHDCFRAERRAPVATVRGTQLQTTRQRCTKASHPIPVSL
jgi:hypothetical protein